MKRNFVEHISHLRSIHFSIVLVCFALLVGMNIDKENMLRKAVNEIEGINQLIEHIDAKPELIYSRAIERVQADNKQRYVTKIASRQQSIVNISFKDSILNFGLNITFPNVVIEPKVFYNVKSAKYQYFGNKDQIIHMKSPNTLGDFKKFWEKYNSNHYGYVFMNNYDPTDSDFRAYIFSSKEPTNSTESLDAFYDDDVRKVTSLINGLNHLKIF